MISLKRDFIHNGKAMMTIDKTGGFVRSELSEIQLQMVMSNVISGHLPMSMKEINQEITFHYDISGKKMLSQTARHEKLSLTGLFQLLLQITQTLLTCPQYMLDEQRYVLHEDYIFTTDPLEEAKVYLCYIPASLEKEVESIAFQISQMVNRMMPYVKALEGTGIQRILQLCNDGDFQLDDLQGLLNELLMSETGVESKSSARTNSAHGVSSSYSMDDHFQEESSQSLINEPGDPNLQRSSRPTPIPAPVTVPKQIPVFSNHSNDSFVSSVPLNPLRRSSSESASENRPGLALGSISHPIFSMKDTYESSGHHSNEGEEKETKQPKKSEKPIYYWLGAMLFASVLWRFLYMDEPTTIRLVMCLVITVTLAAAAYLLSTGKLAGIGNMSLNSTRKQEDDYLNNELSNNEQSSSFSLFQQKEETDFPEKRGIFGGGNKNKEGAEPWRWNSPSKLEESDGELFSHPFKQVASDSNFSFTAPKSLDIEEQETTDHYYDSLRHSTKMLNSSHAQATVLLSDVESVSSSASQSAVVTIKKGILERQAPQAAPEQIELGTASFIIGRSQEVSQYVEEGKGTSRAHVEISKSKDQYYIKDLNSMNGTLLLDQPMIPYKEYLLEEGDFFVIAESKYTFRYV